MLKRSSEDNKWMIVQCATFSKSLNPRNIDKSDSDIRIRILFPFESSFLISLSGCKLTILPDIQPHKPDSDHLCYVHHWFSSLALWCLIWFFVWKHFLISLRPFSPQLGLPAISLYSGRLLMMKWIMPKSEKSEWQWRLWNWIRKPCKNYDIIV